MPQRIEPAASNRAKCRGCGQRIAQGELRFGESLPNPYAEGETTLWFHLPCAAYKRPEALLEGLAGTELELAERESLEHAARRGLAHRRLPRIDGAERAPTGQAKCRSCRAPVPRGSWRVRLVYYQDGRFASSGFVHLACRGAYFETEDIADAALHFSPALSEDERQELVRECRSA